MTGGVGRIGKGGRDREWWGREMGEERKRNKDKGGPKRGDEGG